MSEGNEEIKTIKSIIFDYGGVFTNGSRADFLSKKLGKTPQEQTAIRQFLNSEYIKQAARGGVDTGEIIARLHSLVDHARSESICYALAEACTANAQMLQLVKKLRRRYQVYLISDSLPPYSDYINLHYSSLFEQIFMSDRIGLRKAEGLFQQAKNSCHYLYDQAIYIDDREKNFALLEDEGITGLLFSSYEVLVEDLQKFGVIFDDGCE